MLRTWSFWITFFLAYVALVTGIWGFVEAYTYFEGNSLDLLFGSNWWIFYYVFPLLIAFSFAALRNAREETSAETQDKALDQRNRHVMLDHVENFWVKGILEKSLHGAALLELGIKEDPTAVHYPWTIKKESTDEVLPPGKSMLEVFQEIGMGHSLLILGAPGAGKSTMLFELTRQLVELARNHETEKNPVVFNLASWTEKLSLADWLAEQLNILYYVPRKIAPSWVRGNKLLLLLDGLDEVKRDSRTKCVEAINQFRNEYGLTPMVVCCRLGEYKEIKTKLSFEGAITLQPLASHQISAYINRFGNSLASVRVLLSKDEVLEELAQTPLMLSIMALAYKDVNPNDLVALNNIADQRKNLFSTYIERMFEHSARHTDSTFNKHESLHYLNWLARTMIRNNMITYQIESMQPSWLEEQPQFRLYRLYSGLIVGLLAGLLAGLDIGLVIGLLVGPPLGLYGGLLVGLVGGLLVGLVVSRDRIVMTDRLSWSWGEARKSLIRRLLIGLFGGLLIVLVGGLFAGLLVRLSSRQLVVLLDGLLVVLLGGLLIVLIFGLTSAQIEETAYPGQHLKRSLSNALLAALPFGLFGGLLIGLPFGLPFGLLGGPPLGLYGGLLGGLTAVIEHYSLRWVLVRNHLLPYHLIPFLDYCADLIFLRRVGGSYIFVHRLLMEHFAEMKVEKGTSDHKDFIVTKKKI